MHYYTLFCYDIDAVITCVVYHMCGTWSCRTYEMHSVVLLKPGVTICDADPWAKNKRCTLRRYWPGERERCHRVRRWIFAALPYLARQLLVFYQLPTEGYAQGVRNNKLRQVRATRCIIPYVLCGGLYSLGCRMILMICLEWVPAPLIYPGGQGYKNPSPILDKES
jgi:hypothetical protein